MANKKVLYYCANVVNNNTRNTIGNNEIRDVIHRIINQHSVVNNDLTHLILERGQSVLDRITMDIISNDDNYLFARIGKFKDNSESLMRNINTCEVGDVGDNERVLEIYTYFLFDYNNSIIAYVKGQSAPSVGVIQNIINEYDENFEMDLENIVSPETVRALIVPGSSLGRIEYSYRIPSIYILEQLGLDRATVDNLDQTDYETVSITIKSERRRFLTGEGSIIRGLIDSFSRNTNIDDKSFKGKVPNGASQDYGFELENFHTKVDIPTTRVENGQLVRYTLDEIANEVLARMRANYNSNRIHILRFAGIQE